MATQEHRDLFHKWIGLGRPAVVVEPEGTIEAASICDWVSDCQWRLPRRYQEAAGLQSGTTFAEAARILRPAPQLDSDPEKVAFQLGWFLGRVEDLVRADVGAHYEAFVLGCEQYQKQKVAT